MGRFESVDHVSMSWLAFAAAISALACQGPVQIQAGEVKTSSPVPVVSVRGGEALVAWHRSDGKVYTSSVLGSSTSWSAPSAIADGKNPEVALSTSGAAFAVFSDNFSIAAKVRTSGVWGAAFELEAHSTAFRAVAADAAGNALAVWSSDRVRASVYQNGSGWQPVTDLDTGNGIVKVAMNEAGRGAAAWCGAGVLHAAAYEPGSGWGAPAQTPHTDCCTNIFDVVSPGVSVAIAETGDAYAVGATGTRVCSLRRGAAQVNWSSGTLDTSVGTNGPQVSASVDGHALVAWMRSTSGNRRLKAREYVPGTGWGATLTGPNNLGAGPIGVGYGASGCAAIMFRGGLALAYVTYCTPDAALSSAVNITPGGSLGTAPYFIRSASDPLEPAQGVTVWQQGGTEEIWGARLGI